MSKQQALFSQKNYLDRSTPHGSAEAAEAAAAAFWEDVYAAANKHNIPDVVIGMQINYLDSDQESQNVMVSCGIGMENNFCSLAAYTFGHFRTSDQERVWKAASGKVVSRPLPKK